jgi:hypothetical protein
MVNEITEEKARAALLAAESEAHDADSFVAERQSGGWLFHWNPQVGEVPLGTSPWVVADNGKVREVFLFEDATDLLAELNGRSRPE